MDQAAGTPGGTGAARRPVRVIGWLREHRGLAAFALAYYVVLLGVGAASGNGSTPIYAGFMAVLFALVVAADLRVRFSRGVLWGLAAWGLLHMCGGLAPVGGDRVLYEVWLLPVLRFDHVVHAIGFGFAGLACWEAARRAAGRAAGPAAPQAFTGRAAVLVVVLGGTGLGALNELVEFVISMLVPDSRVGGYENTGWDLVANLAGCLAAGLWAASTTGGETARPRGDRATWTPDQP